MNFLDHISESLETIFWVKILKFVDADADLDPGSGNLFDRGSVMEQIRIWNKHPGSATLLTNDYRTPILYPPCFFTRLFELVPLGLGQKLIIGDHPVLVRVRLPSNQVLLLSR
jgi:hypothetical protein